MKTKKTIKNLIIIVSAFVLIAFTGYDLYNGEIDREEAQEVVIEQVEIIVDAIDELEDEIVINE